MKKLIVAVAIVCAAAMTQAAAFSWSSSNTSNQGKIYGGNSTLAYTTYGAAALYLFDAATYSESDALKAALAGKLDTTKAVQTSTLTTASKISTKQFDYGTQGSKYDFYFVALLGTDKVYISSTKTDQLNPTSGSTGMVWNNLDSTSKSMKTGTTYDGAGVYAAPEPTSGLLLLLGMGALALRRRRA